MPACAGRPVSDSGLRRFFPLPAKIVLEMACFASEKHYMTFITAFGDGKPYDKCAICHIMLSIGSRSTPVRLGGGAAEPCEERSTCLMWKSVGHKW